LVDTLATSAASMRRPFRRRTVQVLILAGIARGVDKENPAAG
jgi:hypothetical protein